MKLTLLNIQIDNLTESELLEKIEKLLNDSQQHYIVTPNPEFLVASRKDKEFKNILNQADLAIPDGIGLKIAVRFLYNQKITRHTGIDTMLKICKLAAQKNKSVFLFGAGEGIAQKTAQVLKNKIPNLKISGAESGGAINYKQLAINNSEEIKLNKNNNLAKINKANPDILFVALGQVKQEKWLAKNLSKLPAVRLAIGVGGSFDYISKKTLRAPKLLRNLGLEWLFRLILEPKRVKRIWNAIVVFMWLVLKEKITKKPLD